MALRDAYRLPHTTYVNHPHAHTQSHLLPHLHNPFAAHHKGQLPYNYIHTPPVDIRETPTEFSVDLELPGVADKSSISIQWTSSRTFVVEGWIKRPNIESGKAAAEQTNGTAKQPDVTKEQPARSETNGTDVLHVQDDGLVLAERVTGHYVRNFDFPVDVDIKGMKATLEAGLLTIRVPKKESEKTFLPKVLVH